MSIYTVHEPPLKADASTPDPDRFAFVRDGFSFWAFLLAPLWMLRHRLWLVSVGYEGATRRRFTLSRRVGKTVGIVVGDDLESAERLFFDAWVDKPWSDQSSAQAPGSGLRASFATGLAP